MKHFVLALLLATSLFAQDQNVDNLIDQLGHDDYTTRERATKELIKIGTKAVEKLQKAATSSDAEVKARAMSILSDIEFNRKLALAYTPKPNLNLKVSMLGGEIFDQFQKQTGVTIAANRATKLQMFTTNWENTTFMQALDSLSEQTNTMWAWKDDSIVFTEHQFVHRPVTYQDGFKAYVTRLDTFRSSNDDINADEASGTFWVYLAVKVDPGIVCRPPRLTVEASDDKGPLAFELNSADLAFDSRDKLRFVSQPLIMKLDPSMKSISLHGRFTFIFPIESKDVEITAFQAPITVEGFTISPMNVGSSDMQLMITRPGVKDLQNCIDFDSVEIEEEGGNKPSVNATWSNYSPDSGILHINVSSESEVTALKAIRFKVRTDFVTKEVPFDFVRINVP